MLGLAQVEIDEVEGEPKGKRWVDEVIDQQEHREGKKGVVEALLGEPVDQPVEAHQLDVQPSHHPLRAILHIYKGRSEQRRTDGPYYKQQERSNHYERFESDRKGVVE